jgi:chemotaxis protein histidine kinase CheA
MVVKPLHSPLENLREYSGATILEDGRIALILDLQNLTSLGARGGQRV